MLEWIWDQFNANNNNKIEYVIRLPVRVSSVVNYVIILCRFKDIFFVWSFER